MRATCSALNGVFQNKQRRRRGHISVTAQHLPRVAELLASKPQHLLHGFEQFAATGMKHEGVEVAEHKSIVFQKKSLSAGASAFFISDGNSGLSTMPKPSSFMSQPMMCSVLRQHHSPLARMRGPARTRFFVLCSKRPAAPSPNSAVETNIAGLGS